MNRKALIAITALSAAVFAAPAMAQMRMPSMSSAYIGGSLGQSKFKVDCGGCDTKDTAFRLFGGYQFNRTIAAELGYTDFGKLGGTGGLEANAWDLSGVFSWPFANQFAAFGRLGLARVEGKASGTFGTASDTKNALSSLVPLRSNTPATRSSCPVSGLKNLSPGFRISTAAAS